MKRRRPASEDACQISFFFNSNLHAERNQRQQFFHQLIVQQQGSQQFFQYQRWQLTAFTVHTAALVSACA
jgi:hypothetical protein